MKKDTLLLIFTRNPELGKVKTRLAKGVGDQAALDIYIKLLDHTLQVTKNLNVDKAVWYSEKVGSGDIWDAGIFKKYKQKGDDLGARMHYAFSVGFDQGYKKIVIIGSDLYDLTSNHLVEAFEELNTFQTVIGPAKDGGYYLLGMNRFIGSVFQNKDWGKETVLKDTLHDLKENSIHLMETLNDIDFAEDLEGYEVFNSYLKNDHK